MRGHKSLSLPATLEISHPHCSYSNRPMRLFARLISYVSNDADYDQIAVTPGLMLRIKEIGVFDFDGAIFADIFDPNASSYWKMFAKYYIPDHRPLWMQFEL